MLPEESSVQIARGIMVITFISGFCLQLANISLTPTVLGAWLGFRIAS